MAARGKTVLDVGCAEGLTSIEIGKAGAIAVHGVEIVPGARQVANKLRGDLPVTFKLATPTCGSPAQLRHRDRAGAAAEGAQPTAVAARLAASAIDMVVLRLPPAHAPTIIDSRSGNEPAPHRRRHEEQWLLLEHAGNDGAFGEWVGYYRETSEPSVPSTKNSPPRTARTSPACRCCSMPRRSRSWPTSTSPRLLLDYGCGRGDAYRSPTSLHHQLGIPPAT